jgi:hypothetical protein
MALTADRSPGDLAPQDRTIERRARWADDATAIGVADVLLALLFTLLSRLPPRISGHCAAGALVGLQHLESSEDGTPGAVTAQQDAAAVFAGCLMPDSSLVA